MIAVYGWAAHPAAQRRIAALVALRGVSREGTTVRKGARTWLAAFGDVLRAVAADPVLLVPALGVIVIAALAAYLAWRFM